MLLEKKNMEQTHWKNEYGTPPSTSITDARLCNKLRADRIVQNVDKEHSEDLAVQLIMEVLRHCYKSLLSLQEACVAMLS
jgi:hypothetical protein